MSDSKEQVFIKYLRASYKQQYHKHKQEKCYVCGKVDNLELHHNQPLANIARDYCKKHNLKIEKNEELRTRIFNDCKDEICGSENLITLCKIHHKNIHSIFGRTYNTKTSEKVKQYLKRQREKFQDGEN